MPVSWQSVGYLMLGSVAVAFCFLSIASYSRVETVTGTIMPDKGVSAIIPTRRGVVVSLPVQDGQYVPMGMELARIRTEEDSASGVSASAQIEAAIGRQDASLDMQMGATAAAAEAQLRQLAAQRAGLSAEIAQLQSQIALQRDLIATAQKDYDRASAIAARGFISQRDIQVREETLLVRRQGLSQLTQSLAERQSVLVEAERNRMQVSAQAKSQAASLAASRAQVAQQAASAAESRSYTLRAPTAGRVTALTARVGQPANAEASLMTIIPAGSILHAELAVSTAAVGFVKQGQDVRLAVDAFPYQRFGTVRGKVLTVPISPVSQRTASGTVVSVYPVTVKLDAAAITAYGRLQPLASGMTLTARIVTEKQSLLQWLFEPLFAVQRR